MATKKKRTSTKKKLKKPKTLASSRYTDREFLEILIGFSERAIGTTGSSVDDFFTQQAIKLKQQLENIKRKL